MHSKHALVAIAVMMLIGVPGATPTGAQEPTRCTFTIDVILSPGFSMTPSSGAFTSNGETGTMHCDGPVNGKVPTGPGTLGNDGRYGTEGADTCASGSEGVGDDFFTIPTVDGPQHIVSHFTFTAGELPSRGDGIVAGRFEGERFSGTFEFMPVEGDCVTSPVTKLVAKGEGVLHG